jgi:hypothetical protein
MPSTLPSYEEKAKKRARLAEEDINAVKSFISSMSEAEDSLRSETTKIKVEENETTQIKFKVEESKSTPIKVEDAGLGAQLAQTVAVVDPSAMFQLLERNGYQLQVPLAKDVWVCFQAIADGSRHLHVIHPPYLSCPFHGPDCRIMIKTTYNYDNPYYLNILLEKIPGSSSSL